MQPAFHLVTADIREAPRCHMISSLFVMLVVGAKLLGRFPMLALHFGLVITLRCSTGSNSPHHTRQDHTNLWILLAHTQSNGGSSFWEGEMKTTLIELSNIT